MYQPFPSGLESAYSEGCSMRFWKHSNRDFGMVCEHSYMQEAVTKKVLIPEATASRAQDWKAVFEAALLEDNPELFALRLKNARDAIVGEIEDSFDTASSTDRRLLLAALNTISGLYEADSARTRGPSALGHSA